MTDPTELGARLCAAIEAQDLSATRALLEAGAPANSDNASGRAALSLAVDAGAGQPKLARVLLAAGADPHRAGGDGQTPWAHVQHKDLPDLVRRFRVAARNLAKAKGPVGVRLVGPPVSETQSATQWPGADPTQRPTWSCVALKLSLEAAGQLWTRRRSVKINRRAATRAVMEQEAQVFLVRLHSVPWTLCLLHTQDQRGALNHRISAGVGLSGGTTDQVLTLEGTRVCVYVKTYAVPEAGPSSFALDGDTLETSVEDFNAYCADQRLLVPHHSFRREGAAVVLELYGVAPGDLDEVHEAVLRPF